MKADYLIGDGLDTSRTPCLQGCRFYYEDPGNLYKLPPDCYSENCDFVYCRDLINETKYWRILLYEWFSAVREGGYLVIEFKMNKYLDLLALKHEISLLEIFRDSFSFVEEGCVGERVFLAVKKTRSLKKPDDSMNKWTFGIITNGKRKELIKKVIESIRAQKIPKYEIIICGSYFDQIENDMKYINFTEKDEKGWITRKKNLVCENARYENIVVMHDRIILENRWYEGMKKWGNKFDAMTNPIYYSRLKKEIPNWCTTGHAYSSYAERKLTFIAGTLDYSDWDRYVTILGSLIILKKSIWHSEPWNERLFWGDREDGELSQRQNKKGILIRLNPYAKTVSEILTVPMLNFKFSKNPTRLGRLKINPLLYTIVHLLDFFGFKRNSPAMIRFSLALNNVFKAMSWRKQQRVLPEGGTL